MSSPYEPSPSLREAFDRIDDEMKADGIDPQLRSNAWNFIYRYAMDVQHNLPHIVESNNLRKPAWRAKAEIARDWLCSRLADPPLTTTADPMILLRPRLGIVHEVGEDSKRSNRTGTALEDTLAYLIHRYTGFAPLLRKSLTRFKGFEIAKSTVSQPDIAFFAEDDLRLVISCLWTSRNDRVSSDIYEAQSIRKRRPDVQVVVVTNEFQHSVLDKLLRSDDIDRVYHVCPALLFEVWKPGETQVDTERLAASPRLAQSVIQYVELRRGLKGLPELFTDIAAVARQAVPTPRLATMDDLLAQENDPEE